MQYNTDNINNEPLSKDTANAYLEIYIYIYYRTSPCTCLYISKEIWYNCLTADRSVPVLDVLTAVTVMSKITNHFKNKSLRDA
jgi:hypothetical protein